MITIVTGDMFGSKFTDYYKDIIRKIDSIEIEFENLEIDSDTELKKFLELEDLKAQVHESIDPFRYQVMTVQILKLKALENCRNKNVMLWHPMATFHPYYVRKFAKQVLKLHEINNHYFIIFTNDEVIINEFRIGILKKQLDHRLLKIKYYWKNEECDIDFYPHGEYKDVPNHFGYEEYQDQLCEILDLQSKLDREIILKNSK